MTTPGEFPMLQHLRLESPLAVIDLETTGTDPKQDRIVEISILTVTPDGRTRQRTRRVHPTIPIPAAATAVHGIRDEDVRHHPTFAQLAESLLALLDGCDLCGFNLKKFDLRLLVAEFARCGRSLPLQGRALVDPLELFHHFERRDLAAAVRFYCGREHAQAHAAAADARATLDVLDAMLARYPDLPPNPSDLHQYLRPSNAVDSSGCFTRVEGQIRFTFGKHRGQPLDFVARTARDYLEWMLCQDFFEDTKDIVRQALGRPTRNASVGLAK